MWPTLTQMCMPGQSLVWAACASIYILINIIFMLDCQQTIENNTKYLVILGLLFLLFGPFLLLSLRLSWARARNILCLPPVFRYSHSYFGPGCLGLLLGLVPEILCIFILFCYRFCWFLFSSCAARPMLHEDSAPLWAKGRHSFGLGRYAYLPFVCGRVAAFCYLVCMPKMRLMCCQLLMMWELGTIRAQKQVLGKKLYGLIGQNSINSCVIAKAMRNNNCCLKLIV